MSAAENIVSKVINEAFKSFTEELNKSATQAEENLLAYEKQTLSESRKILDAAARQEDVLRRTIISSAELAARKEQLSLIEEAVAKVFDEALNKLSTLSGDRAEKVLKQLIAEALEIIDGNVIIFCRKEDSEIVKKIARDLRKSTKCNITVSEKYILCKGGIQASSEDGSVVYDNTYEARLNRIRQLLRKEVVKILTVGERDE
jgi:V/A-type H+-transporting ATPase subunit E